MIILWIAYNQYKILQIKLYMKAHIEENAKNSLNKFFTFLRTWKAIFYYY